MYKEQDHPAPQFSGSGVFTALFETNTVCTFEAEVVDTTAILAILELSVDTTAILVMTFMNLSY
jgi:hypothetical protein